jgi:hypothetical protein
VKLCGTALVLVIAACGDNGRAGADAAVDTAVDAHVPSFGAPVTLSDPANQSFVPVIAARAGRVVIAWHDFPAGGGESRVVTRTSIDGTLGPIVPIVETLAGPKRPTLAATASGFVLAWDAVDAGTAVIRSVDLDADGHAIGAPITISAAGVAGSFVRVAAHGDDVAWAWTDGSAHFFARRGPVETVAAKPVGTTLLAGGLLNFPRIAITSTGVLLLAYRDGGAQPADWDVLLVIRQIGGTFQGPLNVSRSTGLLSDDISLAIEPDDTLDLVWVDQNPDNVNAFEVDHATRDGAGLISVPTVFGTQGMMTWTPSVVPGLSAVWHSGGSAGGDLWLATAGGAPQPILPGEQGGSVALARAEDDSLHFAYGTLGTPRQVRYAVQQ